MNWFIIAGGLLVAIGIVFLIRYLIGNTTDNDEKTKIPEVPIEPSIKPKMSYGKIWNWVIPILIISAIIGAILIVPKYYNKGDKTTKLSIPASYIWTKKPHQYGRDPEKRTSGYLNATVTEDSDSKFCFTVHVDRNEDSHYNGRRFGTDRIEGSWKNPPDGGKWYLEKDKNNPNLYKGGVNDPYLSDWAYLELEILN